MASRSSIFKCQGGTFSPDLHDYTSCACSFCFSIDAWCLDCSIHRPVVRHCPPSCGPSQLTGRPALRTVTAHRGPESRPRPPSKAPRAAQDPTEKPKSDPGPAYRPPSGSLSRLGLAHFSSKEGPQDHPQRPREPCKTALKGPKSF